MSRPKGPETKVVSFRVPAADFKRIEKEARRQKKKRAHFVEELFIPALDRFIETAKAA